MQGPNVAGDRPPVVDDSVRRPHLVLDKGRLVEEGTHDELLAHGGLYAELYRTQFRAVEAGLAEG